MNSSSLISAFLREMADSDLAHDTFDAVMEKAKWNIGYAGSELKEHESANLRETFSNAQIKSALNLTDTKQSDEFRS